MTDIQILDGGLGQELHKYNIEGPKRLWSTNALIQDPSIVRNIHLQYIRAGADVITTNTYVTTPYRLRRDGLEPKINSLIETACKMATEARLISEKHNIKIAGSIPPLYGSYRPELDRDVLSMKRDYDLIVEAMAPHVDCLLIETVATVAQAKAALLACRAVKLPIWLAWTLADDESGTIRDGTPLEEAMRVVDTQGVEAVLFNCCAPESVECGLKKLKTAWNGRVGVYANGFVGIPAKWEAGNLEALGTRPELTPERYTEFARLWCELGATIIGGCCEIGPSHIEHLAFNLRGAL